MDTILCVDDETSVLRSLRRLFIDEPWEVLFATSGAEGLKAICEHPVDVVLADFRMPEMDGVEFLRRVWKVHPDCMRVVLSGHADIKAIIAALNDGKIYKFISKPWDDHELLDTVRKLLQHQRVKRENRVLGEKLRRLNDELMAKNEEIERLAARTARRAEALEQLVARASVPLLAVDTEGTVVVASQGARQVLGRDPVGMPVTELPLEDAPDAAGEAAVRHMRLSGNPAVVAVLSAAQPVR